MRRSSATGYREIAAGVHRVERFVEKPDAATAQAYLDEGCYDWNGGIFMFAAGRYLEARSDRGVNALSDRELLDLLADRSGDPELAE